MHDFSFSSLSIYLQVVLSVLAPYYRKRGSASHFVREMRSVREPGERYRERDGSDVIIVALKLAMSFALFLAKRSHLFLPFLNCAEFTLSVAKNVALLETVRISGCTALLFIEKMNQINTKNYSVTDTGIVSL